MSPLSSAPYLPRVPPVYPSWFRDPNNIYWGVHDKRTHYSVFSSPVYTASILGPNILLSNLFPKTLSIPSSLIVTDQFGHQYKTTDKSCSSIYCNFHIFGVPNARRNMYQMVAISMRIQYAVRFLANGELISKGLSEVFELCQNFRQFLYFCISACILRSCSHKSW